MHWFRDSWLQLGFDLWTIANTWRSPEGQISLPCHLKHTFYWSLLWTPSLYISPSLLLKVLGFKCSVSFNLDHCSLRSPCTGHKLVCSCKNPFEQTLMLLGLFNGVQMFWNNNQDRSILLSTLSLPVTRKCEKTFPVSTMDTMVAKGLIISALQNSYTWGSLSWDWVHSQTCWQVG